MTIGQIYRPSYSLGHGSGGDRDGNPNVTPEVTLETLATLNDAARHVYLEDIAYVRDRLTQTVEIEECSSELLERWSHLSANKGVYHGEIYRHIMDAIYEALESGAYTSGDVLLHDLKLVADSLKRGGSPHSAGGTLGGLIRKVQLFGLHLLPLDVREDARLHIRALTEIFKHYDVTDDYAALPEVENRRCSHVKSRIRVRCSRMCPTLQIRPT